MRGHTRPASIHRLIAERFAIQAGRDEAARIAHEAEVRAEATAILAERGYTLRALDGSPFVGMWSAHFAPTGNPGETFIAGAHGGDLLLDKLRLYPRRGPGGRLVNNARIVGAFMSTAIEGFQSLALFTRPQ